jgi:hypothetical protein
MPPSKYKKPDTTLRNAPTYSLFVQVRCGRCRVVHLYLPDDIIELVGGDLAIYEVVQHFKCERCQSREYMKASWKAVYGPDVGKTAIRRLVRVRYVRVPVWRDEVI